MSTILIVDDEERIRRIYKSLFEREGYKAIACSNIVDARKYLKAISIDLILLDINMGEFGGEVLYEVAQCFHKDTKVIVSSVYPVEDQRSLMPKACDYYDKSGGNKVLLEKVQKTLSNNHKQLKKNILVVDDDMRERRILHHILTQAGYNAVEFSDNNKLLSYLDKNNKDIDLIILDLAMPTITGIDYFEIIRDKYPGTKIMIASNYPVDDQKTYIFDATDYFDKTNGKKVLLEKIRKLI